MPRLIADAEGRQWAVGEAGFAGDRLIESGMNTRDQYSRVHLVFDSIDGKERRTIWRDLPLNLHAVSADELLDWLRTATPIAR